MKLFNGLEAFKFPQENLILITRNKYLYYIYKPQYRFLCQMNSEDVN